ARGRGRGDRGVGLRVHRSVLAPRADRSAVRVDDPPLDDDDADGRGVRVLTERQWHRVGLGFLPITVFTWMMLGTTFLHWNRFRHGSLPFEIWFWIYL